MKNKLLLIIVALLIVLGHSLLVIAEEQKGDIDVLLASIEARIDLTSDQKVALEKLVVEIVPADQQNLPIELVNQLISYQLKAKEGINLDELKQEVSGVVVATNAGVDLHIFQEKLIPDVAKSLQGIDPAAFNQVITQLTQLNANGFKKAGMEEIAQLMIKAYEYKIDITAELALLKDYTNKGKDLEPILKQIRDKLKDAKVAEKDAEKAAKEAAKDADKSAKDADKSAKDAEKAARDAEKAGQGKSSENAKDEHKDDGKVKDGGKTKKDNQNKDTDKAKNSDPQKKIGKK